METMVSLSRAQLAIWRHLQISPEKAAYYNLADYQDIRGRIDVDVFLSAIRLAVENCTSFRVSFRERGNEVFQVIGNAAVFDVPYIDCSGSADPDGAALSWMKERHAQLFQPDSKKLFGFALLKLTDTRHYWYCHYHHLIIDGYGQAIFRGKVAKVYTALSQGVPIPSKKDATAIEDDTKQYLSYLASDSEYRNSDQFDVDQRHWRSTSDDQEAVTLSVRQNESAPSVVTSKEIRMRAPNAVLTELNRLTADTGIKTQRFMIAVVLAYLQRATGMHKVCVGLPHHGRIDPSSQGLVATCANVLPMCFSLDKAKDIQQFAHDANSQLRNMLGHSRHRFEDIRHARGMRPDDANPFRVIVNVLIAPDYLNYGAAQGFARAFTPAQVDDLSIYVFTREQGGELILKIQGNSRLYEQWELDAHVDALQSMLEKITADPARPLERISLVAAEEDTTRELRDEVIIEGDSAHRLIHERVLKVANESPCAVAIRYAGADYTYEQIVTRSHFLADRLRKDGVKSGHLVGILLDDPCEWLTTMLAILKCGAGYLPLDTALPGVRLGFILADAKPFVVVSHSRIAERMRGCHENVFCLDAVANVPLSDTSELLGETLPSNCLAYCIYTSGSTGEPNGVLISHANVLHHSDNMRSLFKLRPADKVLQFASFSFDASVEEIVPTWLAGATLVVPHERKMSLLEFHEYVQSERVTVLNLPTAFWHEWVEHMHKAGTAKLPDQLRLVIVGGEQAHAGQLKKWAAMTSGKSVEWINTYGPTEATVSCASYKLDVSDVPDYVPIGTPLAGTTISILDVDGLRVPVGLAGEIHIGGKSVAMGYLNRPELTRERFIDAPRKFGRTQLYRSGDRGRYLPNGSIEFLGRNDRQIKIRGFRVELAEIESQLRQCPVVMDCAVMYLPAVADRRQLVAFVVPNTVSFDKDDLVGFLRSRLPGYMIPSRFVPLDAFPLSPTGKIDFRNLAEIGLVVCDTRGANETPRTQHELLVAGIWCEVLQLSSVGVHDNFFELGGDSLGAIRVIAEIARVTGRDVSLRLLFLGPTVAELAMEIARLPNDESARDR